MTTHTHLAPRLKKEYSYISTPPLGLRGLFYGDLYFTFTFTFIIRQYTRYITHIWYLELTMMKRMCEWDKACRISSVCEWRVTATTGRAMAQAIRRRPLTAGDHVRTHASPHAICGAQSGTQWHWDTFLSSSSGFSCHCHSSNAPLSLTN